MKRLAMTLALFLAACTSGVPETVTPDKTVALQIKNVGAEPLSCKIVFGHWVERDLGKLAPGDEIDVEMKQVWKDGALYIDRYDNERKMMIENIVCGRTDNWRDTLGQINLTKARAEFPDIINASCQAPSTGDRVSCTEFMAVF